MTSKRLKVRLIRSSASRGSGFQESQASRGSASTSASSSARSTRYGSENQSTAAPSSAGVRWPRLDKQAAEEAGGGWVQAGDGEAPAVGAEGTESGRSRKSGCAR